MALELTYFSGPEAIGQKRFQTRRDRFFAPLARRTPRFITPVRVTGVSAALLLGFVFYAFSAPVYALMFLIAHVGFDAFDGALARTRGVAHNGGALLDMLNDHTGFVVVTLILAIQGLMDATLGIIYVYTYTLLVTLLIARNALGIPPRFTARSKYVLFALYGVWVFTGFTLFNLLVLVMIPITLVLIAIDIRALYKALKHVS